MMTMTTEQKLVAIQRLAGDVSLRMRKPGDWYVSARGVEIGGNGVLSGAFGNGATPDAAIEDHWRQWVTDLKPGLYLVKNAMGSARRRHYRWDAFMWAEIPEAATPEEHTP